MAWLLVAMTLRVATPAPFRQTAPSFRVKSLTGATLDLDVLRHRGPVLVDFWATWCGPCVHSLPELEALHRRYSTRGLTVVGISIDGPRNYAKVRPFVARTGLTFPIALDEDGSLQESYRIVAVPMSILIDTSGAVVKVTQGYRPGEGEALAAAIRGLLVEAETPADTAAAPPAAP